MKSRPPLKRRLAASVAAAVIASAASAPPASTGVRDRPGEVDWPQWRGPSRNGISGETGWLAAWPKTGPRQRWKTSVGVGYSSVSVCRGRVYTMGNAKDTDTVYCLDADTGAVIWRRSYACKGGVHPGTRATPTVHGQRVYTFSRAGHVFCFEAASGKVVWSKNLCDELKVKSLRWGLSSSPLIEKNLVILSAGTCAVALDASDGKILWRAESDLASYASPVAFGAPGQRRVLVMAGEEAVCLRVADGKALWRHPWRPRYPNNCSDPIVSGDKVFLSSGYGQGCALLQIGPGKPTVLWQNRYLKTHIDSPVLWGGHVFGFDGDIRGRLSLQCLEFKTGELKWSEPVKGSLTLADGKLIVLTTEGELIVAKAVATGFKPLARAKVLSGTCWTAPVLSGRGIYCRSHQGDLVCLDVSAP